MYFQTKRQLAYLAYVVSVLFLLGVHVSAQETVLLDCEGEWADSPLCQEREEAFDLKARIEALIEDLGSIEDPPWEAEAYRKATESYEAGIENYKDQYYGDAANKFDSALQVYSELKQSFDDVVTKSLEESESLLKDERYADALTPLRRLATWFPDSESINNQLQHATNGVALTSRIQEIEELISRKSFDEAEIKLSNFPTGFWTAPIGDARLAIAQHRKTQSFNDLMSKGIQHSNAKRWVEAHLTFTQALALEPESTTAKDAQQEADDQIRHQQLKVLRSALETQQTNEEWDAAIESIDAISALDPDDTDLKPLKEQLQSLLSIDTQLSEALQKVSATMNPTTRSEILNLLTDSSEYEEYTTIQTKRSKLEEEFAVYTTPVKVTLISDRRSEISIRPGQKIGRFSKKTLSIYPGSYEVIGRRSGYREERKSITITPGSEPIEVHIKCDVRF